eukprot:TRINITY_DN13463_c1_g1_i1.p1 TRINITY_DN13463_c1_g1~~TRINITY_DN13463_c1_g1_i1.p1  ORF type:complete len:300 (-),score=35.00 TRINITY_DN13463_c1_g1_i1:6-905(-)
MCDQFTNDIWKVVLSLLSPSSMLQMRAVCQHWRTLIGLESPTISVTTIKGVLHFFPAALVPSLDKMNCSGTPPPINMVDSWKRHEWEAQLCISTEKKMLVVRNFEPATIRSLSHRYAIVDSLKNRFPSVMSFTYPTLGNCFVGMKEIFFSRICRNRLKELQNVITTMPLRVVPILFEEPKKETLPEVGEDAFDIAKIVNVTGTSLFSLTPALVDKNQSEIFQELIELRNKAKERPKMLPVFPWSSPTSFANFMIKLFISRGRSEFVNILIQIYKQVIPKEELECAGVVLARTKTNQKAF